MFTADELANNVGISDQLLTEGRSFGLAGKGMIHLRPQKFTSNIGVMVYEIPIQNINYLFKNRPNLLFFLLCFKAKVCNIMVPGPQIIQACMRLT